MAGWYGLSSVRLLIWVLIDSWWTHTRGYKWVDGINPCQKNLVVKSCGQ